MKNKLSIDLLLLSLNKQKSIQDETLEDWKSELDQLDDILKIGFKVF